jgi:hypothetical protein
MVTHEPDMAAYTRRQVRFYDGLVMADEPTHGATRLPAVLQATR